MRRVIPAERNDECEGDADRGDGDARQAVDDCDMQGDVMVGAGQLEEPEWVESFGDAEPIGRHDQRREQVQRDQPTR